MFFSVIIPSYNSKRTLPHTVESVLNSNYKDFEIIIVDDCSEEKAEDYISAAANIKIIRNGSQKGPAYTRNLGAREAAGDILVFLDSDIYVKEDTLSRIKKGFEENGPDSITGIYDSRMPHDDFLSNYFNLRIRRGYLNMSETTEACNAALLAVKKEIFEKVGEFDPGYKAASIEDIEFGRRFVSAGYKIILDKELSVVHDKKMTLKAILKNDFFRPADRVQFVLNAKDFGDVFKKRRFSYVSLGQLVATALTPFFWISLLSSFFNSYFLLAAVALLIICAYLNRDWLFYFYRERGLVFSLKGLFFILITLTAALLGIVKGLATNLRPKNRPAAC
ncbi:MAG: glycosyltransferase [Candidatus Omnitrophica bacterium]|nr:glycosyltransferase [Candidatus Omnitrophota bacterium]